MAELTTWLNATVALVKPREDFVYCSGVSTSYNRKPYILTAAHCVLNEDGKLDTTRVYIQLRQGFVLPVGVLKYDSEQDVAVLSSFGFMPKLPLSVQHPIYLQEVIMIGHPVDMRWTMSRGYVSHPDRLGKAITDTHHWFQTSIGAGPGNSGGPVLSTDGSILGLVSFIHKRYSDFSAISHTEELWRILKGLDN